MSAERAGPDPAPDGGSPEPEPDMEDVLEDLEDLEELVDTEAEREQVREAIRTARRAHRPRLFGRVRDSFEARDVGEAVVGSFVFGIPMVVEEGTLEVGAAIAGSPGLLAGTALFGLGVVVGILQAVGFQDGDRLLGVEPERLASILLVPSVVSVSLMTAWGRVDWADPAVAFAQCLVTAVVMAVGAAVGDILPST